MAMVAAAPGTSIVVYRPAVAAKDVAAEAVAAEAVAAEAVAAGTSSGAAEKRGVLFTGLGLALIWKALFEVWPGSAEYRLARNFTHTRMGRIALAADAIWRLLSARMATAYADACADAQPP
jgi:hypothetical protein